MGLFQAASGEVASPQLGLQGITVIALLDATELMRDPFCSGTAWRIVAHANARWNLRVLVTEVALAEAVAGFGREVDKAKQGFEGFAVKHFERLGLSGSSSVMHTAMDEAAKAYPDTLRETLSAAGVELVPTVEPPHMEVVLRAVNRRRPCDDKGDGYRDTLNWLTVLSIAAQHQDEQVVWISNNAKDFADDSSHALHESLVEELSTMGAADRVRLIGTLADLVLELAGGDTSEGPEDIHSVHRRVRQETVLAYLARELPRSVGTTPVDPRRCGLPVGTLTARIVQVAEPRDLELHIRGSVVGRAGTADSVAAEFVVRAETALLIDPASSVDVAEPFIKQLVYSGLLTLDGFDRPVGCEVTRVRAIEGDEGVVAWSTYDLFRRLRQDPGDYLQATAGPLGQWAALQRALDQTVSGGALKDWAETQKRLQESLGGGALKDWAEAQKRVQGLLGGGVLKDWAEAQKRFLETMGGGVLKDWAEAQKRFQESLGGEVLKDWAETQKRFLETMGGGTWGAIDDEVSSEDRSVTDDAGAPGEQDQAQVENDGPAADGEAEGGDEEGPNAAETT